MADALQKLFGSPTRTKLLRLFLFNPRQAFTLLEITERSHVKPKEARREVELFSKIRLVRSARKAARSSAARYTLNTDFEHVRSLQELLLNVGQDQMALRYLRGTGSLKMIILSGVFMGEWDASVDMLVVGDRLNARKLRQRIRKIEMELGKELRYAALSTQDFFFRLNMNDHLLRDTLDYPHRIALDKLNIGLK